MRTLVMRTLVMRIMTMRIMTMTVAMAMRMDEDNNNQR